MFYSIEAFSSFHSKLQIDQGKNVAEFKQLCLFQLEQLRPAGMLVEILIERKHIKRFEHFFDSGFDGVGCS
ncbi:hypothetical protein D3C74_393060 [compost metagenome]